MITPSVTIKDLRKELEKSGLTRTESLGEHWAGQGLTVIVGANEIVITESPSVVRRMNRAAGGMLLAIEYIRQCCN